MEKDIRISYVNVLYPIKKILQKCKVEQKNGNIRCSFHDDLKPSARVYDNAVYCFRCRRFFYNYNYIVKCNLDFEEIYKELLTMYNNDMKKMDEDYKNRVIKEVKVEIKEKKNIIDYTKEYFK